MATNWNSPPSKYITKLLYGSLCGCVRHYYHLWPFQVCIHHHHEHFTFNRTCKVNVYSAPGALRILPWMDRGQLWIISHELASTIHVCTGYSFNVFVNGWPPHVGPGQAFHLHHSMWPTCSSSAMLNWCLEGTTTRIPLPLLKAQFMVSIKKQS